MGPEYYSLTALLTGFIADQLFGDPMGIPHPVAGFGNLISFFEKCLNKGKYLLVKGAFMTFILVAAVFFITKLLITGADRYHPFTGAVLTAVIVFFSLSARTLRIEVSRVFEVVDKSPAEGRKHLSRIVGRDTSALGPQHIRIAALETLAENLSDGVVAPLFWFALLGAPGMFAYKMINTLDSMTGYKNDRYLYFGRFAARLDDLANFIPARLTSFLMLLAGGKISCMRFVLANGKKHASPNSGYPESALAGILDCRFGGPNFYFGKIVRKPWIGTNARAISADDLSIAIRINKRCEWLMLFLTIIPLAFLIYKYN
jgi:adenosylcobinamide-phosphate synthase